MNLKEQLLKKLQEQIKEPLTLEVPPNSAMGDYALPCFKLSKKAIDLQKSLNLPKYIEKTEIKGSYLNFFIDKSILILETLKEINKKKNKYGSNLTGKNKKALIEHTSINPNASPHLGRARNAIIGDSIVRLLKFEGFKVETHYYVNDIGKQIAMLVLASKNKTPKFNELLNLYVEFNKLLETEPELEKEVFNLLNLLEKGNKKTLVSFRKIVKICMNGQTEILKELGIKFDKFDFESDFLFNNSTNEILKELESKSKMFIDKEGRKCINLEGFNLPMENPYLPLTRADGTSLYMLRDLAYTLHKINKKVSKNVLVLGEDQKLYYLQLKTILSILGHEAPEVVHYSFVLLPSGKMSTRNGEVVLLEDLMKEIKQKSQEEINKRGIKIANLSKIIGYGALKFSFLKVSPEKNIVFDINQALNFEGDSAPYIQYAYARASSILKKASSKTTTINKKVISNLIKSNKLDQVELKLVNQLNLFKYEIKNAMTSLKTTTIANYSLHLAELFNEFYQKCQVLNEENLEIKNFRLLLVASTKQTLENSLNLLGIEAPESM